MVDSKIDRTAAGREAFLARFADREALSAHMKELAARRSRLIRLGQWLDALLAREGFERKDLPMK